MITPKRPTISMSIALLMLVVALAIAVALGIAAAGDRLMPGDVSIAKSIQQLDGELASNLATLGNRLGSTLWAALAISLALVGAAILRAWPESLYLTALLVLRLLGTQLKPLFNSPRPTDDLVLITGVHDGTGYPSGHALTAATMALGLSVLAWRHIPSRGLAVLVIAVLIGIGLLVGWARIWSGAHWPSDVVGGYLFGLVIVAIGAMVLDRQVTAQRSQS